MSSLNLLGRNHLRISSLILITFIVSCSTTTSAKKTLSLAETKKIVENLKDSDRKANLQFLRPVKTSKYYFWINYFAKRDNERFQRYINNGFKHKELIEDIFAQYGLPKELFFVGMIESGYYMRARSHAKAVGPWQFVSDTAKRYGLMINRFVDERVHLVKATHAAAQYFRELYNIFGSWELALTAYNSGEYGLMRRIKKYKTKNYYKLSRRKIIPRETRNYVPKVLAAMSIMSRPTDFGFEIPKQTKSPYHYTKKISLNSAVALRNIAKNYNLSVSELKHLNPDLKQWRTPKLRYNRLEVFVPKSSHNQKVLTMIRPHLYKRRPFEFYKIRRGDNLSQIARKTRTTVASLRKVNGISRGEYIKSGQIIKIPRRRPTHIVRRGENLHLIAKKYDVSVKKIMRANKLNDEMIYPGQKLHIAQN